MTPFDEILQQRLFTVAYTDFKGGLDRHSFFKVHNQAISENLVQDTFLKTWSYIVKGGQIDVMKAFLYHVLNGLIIDEYRKHKTLSLEALAEKGFEPRDESEHLFTTLDSKRAVLMIALLPDKYQRLMNMKYIEDLTLEEMSSATGQSRNTAAVQINRGIKKLKKLYNR